MNRYFASGNSNLSDTRPNVNILRKMTRDDSSQSHTKPQVFNPNIPGRWWIGSKAKEASQPIKLDMLSESSERTNLQSSLASSVNEGSSIDEFYETCESLGDFTKRSATFEVLRSSSPVLSPLSSSIDEFDPEIKSHMTEPLLPEGSLLDFSPIRNQIGKTNVFTANPLARAWEFNSKADECEYSILNILADEFEVIDKDDKEPASTFWQTIKKHTIGLNEDEYDDYYPWAKYSMKDEHYQAEGSENSHM